MISLNRFNPVFAIEGPVQNTPNFVPWSLVTSNCPANKTYTRTAPTNAPANWAITYPGTIDQEKLPIAASAIVSAGLKWAPDEDPKINAGTSTASPHANVICTAPAPFIPDLSRFTFATTPSPSKIKSIVPINSAI